jgi:hypothetical protein
MAEKDKPAPLSRIRECQGEQDLGGARVLDVYSPFLCLDRPIPEVIHPNIAVITNVLFKIRSAESFRPSAPLDANVNEERRLEATRSFHRIHGLL